MIEYISILGLICALTIATFAIAWVFGVIVDWFGVRSSKLFDSIAAAVDETVERRAKQVVRKPAAKPPQGLQGGYRDAMKPSLEEEIRALKERVAFLENAPTELNYEIEEAGKELIALNEKKHERAVRLDLDYVKNRLESAGDQILTRKEQAKRKREDITESFRAIMKKEEKMRKESLDLFNSRTKLTEELILGARPTLEKQQAYAAELEKTLEDIESSVSYIASGRYRVK